ncbi:D-amino-acid dehydrogenase [Tenacibaculum skagerrakense]|uniref:D-amino-acid dehydrogenase n=1 Tax=Tenacibaculum skagerrakense TaxID=186571 RepID=A0A4R2P3Y5_9FLAO|nr:FAD-dependent oxidoreductase [Tenacibaculum skagerrakense]TCP28445.1 D-amino-acid dehydrogenase [Tenacibaculum skagerrakense]
MSKKVVIIGGGIIGLCSAYYLQKENHEVVVVDKSDFSSGASYVNAGIITPSHIIPLAAPGMITKGIKWMFNSSSPFYVKPRLNIDFLEWSWLFKKSATKQKVITAIPVIRDINLLSRSLYEEMKSERALDFFYEHKGLLMLYKTEKAGEDEWNTGKKAIECGLKVANLSQDELRKLEPSVDNSIKGAVHYLSDAHMSPSEFMRQMKSYLVSKGVVFKSGTEVKSFNVKSNSIESIKTKDEEIHFDELVVASGSWTQNLLKDLQLKVPIQAGKGYRIDVQKETNITFPSILLEAKVAVTPMDGYTRFAGTMEIGGINHIINPKRVDAITKAAIKYYSNLEISNEAKLAADCGLRPCSPDGLPYIGRVSSFKNLTVAAGHAMMGWSLGPATGKLVSEIITDYKTSMDISPFSVERFK